MVRRIARPKRVVHIDPEPKDDTITLYHLHRYFDGCWVKGKLDPVLGNEESRIAILLNWAVCQNGTIVRGESGSAKTKIMNAIVALLFGSEALDNKAADVFVVGSGSDKAQLNPVTAREIDRAKLCYIPEYQNAKVYEWIFKLWLENRSAPYSRSIDGGRGVENFDLQPLPILTSLAEGNEDMPELSNEMKRRLVSFWTRSDEDLNKSVHKKKAYMRRAPDEDLVTLDDDDTYSLQMGILYAMDDTHRVINPGSDVGHSVVPPKYAASNTFVDYWFDLIEGVTKFYKDERLATHRYLFATPGDNYVAATLVSDVIRDLSLGIPPLGKELLSTDFLPKIEVFGAIRSDTREQTRHIGEIVNYFDEQGIPRSKQVIKNMLDRLVGGGFLNTEDDKHYYRTRDLLDNNDEVDWALLIDDSIAHMKEKFPDQAKAYTDIAYTYIDPFDGLVKDIPRREKPKPREERGSGIRNV